MSRVRRGSCTPFLAVLVAMFVLCVVRPTVSRADLVDEELLATWQRWSEDPLDLRSATAEDIALLPGSDLATAHAVVTLRESGGMKSWSNLMVSGAVSTSVLAAWEPLVRLEESGRSTPRGEGEIRAFRDSAVDRSPRDGARLRWKSERVRAGLSVREGQVSSRRGFLELGGSGLALTVGDLRARGGLGIAIGDPAMRTRTGPTRRPRARAPRGRLDHGPRQRGVALQHASDRAVLWAAWVNAEEDESSARIGAFGSRGDLDAGLAIEYRTLGARWESWIKRARPRAGEVWAGLAQSGGGLITHAGVAERRGRLRAELAWTAAGRPGRAGNDPLTGAPLDREHRAWQAQLSWRERPWRVELLVRRRARGKPGAVSRDERWRFEWVRRSALGASGPRRTLEVGLRLGQDEDLDEAGSVEPYARLWCNLDGDPQELRIVYRRSGAAKRAAHALAATWRKRTSARTRWSASTVWGFGGASSPWVFSRPLLGPAPLWVQPDGAVAATAVDRQVFARTRVAAWAWVRLGGGDRGESGLGILLQRDFPLVRSLQPSATQGP